MTWSYLPAPRTDIDRIRFLVGDTLATDPQVQDEEIGMALELEGNPAPMTARSPRPVLYRAASRVARAIAAHYARVYNSTISNTKQQAAVLLAHYNTVADDLWRQASRSVGPRVGGQSRSEKLDQALDPDRTQPFFARGQFSEPGTGPGSTINDAQAAQEFGP